MLLDRRAAWRQVFGDIGEALAILLDGQVRNTLQAEIAGTRRVAAASGALCGPDEARSARAARVRLADGAEIEAEVYKERSSGGRTQHFIRKNGRKLLVTPLGDGFRQRSRTRLNLSSYQWSERQLGILSVLSAAGGHAKLQDVAAALDVPNWRSLVGQSRPLSQAGYTSKTKDGLAITSSGLEFLAAWQAQGAAPEAAPREGRKARASRAAGQSAAV
jgi:hypothetical protein